MVIARIEAADVLADCRQSLGLSEPSETIHETLDEILLAALARRSAGIHCPCSRATLRSSLLESLRLLSEDEENTGGSHRCGDRGVDYRWGSSRTQRCRHRRSGCQGNLGICGATRFCQPAKRKHLPVGRGPRPRHIPAAFIDFPASIMRASRGTIAPEPGEDLVGDLQAHGMRELSEEGLAESPDGGTAPYPARPVQAVN